METIEYKRAIRMLGEVSIEDKAVVISRMKCDGTIVTTNCGDAQARRDLYSVLNVIPTSVSEVEAVFTGEGQ